MERKYLAKTSGRPRKTQLIDHVKSRMTDVRLIITEGEDLLRKYNG
jgi:hypothetical protein